MPQVGLAFGPRVRGQGNMCCPSGHQALNLAGRKWEYTGVWDFPQAFLLVWYTGEHLLTYQCLIIYFSSCPSYSLCIPPCTWKMKHHWEEVFAQGTYTYTGEELEMLRDFILWLFVPHLVVLPLSASPHLLSFLIWALSPPSLCAFVPNSLLLFSVSQLFCLLL